MTRTRRGQLALLLSVFAGLRVLLFSAAFPFFIHIDEHRHVDVVLKYDRGYLPAPGNDASRIENRVGESAANPYLYIASQIYSGLDGIERRLQAPEPVETPYDGDAPMLPASLIDAIQAFHQSELFRGELGDAFVDYLCRIKQAEWDRYINTVSEWEHQEYFSLF